jgi:hypothetical protein
MNTARLDVSDPALQEAILKVRSDAEPETFCIFGYEGKAKITLKECSSGNVYDALEDDLEDEEVSYAFLRVTGTRDQESKTVKFVFIVYVGPNVGGMQRGRVGAHKGDIKSLVGQSHVDFQTDEKEELSEASITEKLKKASGANYDLGSNASGYESKAGDIGKSAAAKYKALEKESNIGPVVFNAKSHVVDKNVSRSKAARSLATLALGRLAEHSSPLVPRSAMLCRTVSSPSFN